MAYIIDIKNISFLNIFKNESLLLFIEKSMEVAKKLDIGCYEKLILDDSTFSIPQNTLLKCKSDCIYESHKKYIDIHIIVNGIENIELLDIDGLHKLYEENFENDYYLYTSKLDTKKIVLDKNTIGIFLFEDIHKVGIESSGIQQNIVKVVLKIKKNIFEKEFIYA